MKQTNKRKYWIIGAVSGIVVVSLIAFLMFGLGLESARDEYKNENTRVQYSPKQIAGCWLRYTQSNHEEDNFSIEKFEMTGSNKATSYVTSAKKEYVNGIPETNNVAWIETSIVDNMFYSSDFRQMFASEYSIIDNPSNEINYYISIGRGFNYMVIREFDTTYNEERINYYLRLPSKNDVYYLDFDENETCGEYFNRKVADINLGSKDFAK